MNLPQFLPKHFYYEELKRQERWDCRFLAMARLIASWSKDPSTKCGAVIVRPDKTVASVGFNGLPRQMQDLPDYYVNRDEKYDRIIHAEMNALLCASEPIKGYTLYTIPFASCHRCAVHLIQAGITRFVFPTIPPDKIDRWKGPLEKTVKYLNECGIEFKEYSQEAE